MQGKGEIPSTSQHLCPDSFHGNEDHAWHRRHNSSLKRPCPASSLRAFAKGVSLSPARVMACVAMLFTASSGTRSVARSRRRSWRPCPAACPLGLTGIPLGILYIQFSRYSCQRTAEASRPLTKYINIIIVIIVNICFI